MLAHWSEVRAQQLDDLRFAKLGDQWPADVVRSRMEKNRPCLTINRMPSFIRQVVNDARLNKPTVRVRPADSKADVKTAEVYNGIIRHIEQVGEGADVAYDTGADFSVSSGIGFWRIDIDYAYDDTFDHDLKISRIANPLAVLFDDRTTAADSSDWRDCIITDLVSRETFKVDWPDAEMSDFPGQDSEWMTEESVRIGEYFERTPYKRTIVLMSDGSVVNKETLMDPEKFAVFVSRGVMPTEQEREVDSFKVTHYIVSGSEILKKTPWPGCFIPIVPVYGDEINVDGKRYFHSLIHDAKDAQRNYNYWRTSATELVALAPKNPWIGRKGTFTTDAEKWATANTDVHSFIEYDGPEAPMRSPFAGVPAGALQEALNASDDMKSVMGIHDASLGARSNETSGVAIRQRQKEGDVSTFHFIDNLTRAIRCTGRILIDLIPHVYGPRQQLRILGEDGNPKNVIMGQPTMVDGVMHTYDLSAGRYDLIVETGPSFSTRREETAAAVTEFVRAAPQVAPLMLDIIARNSDWPEADKIADRLASQLPPELQEPKEGQPPKPPPPPPPEVMAAMAKMKMSADEHAQKTAQSDQAHQQEMMQSEAKAQTDSQQAMAKATAAIIEAKARAEAMLIEAQGKADAAAITARGKAAGDLAGGLIASINEPNQF
jgi:hypothetical protein